MPIRGHAHLSDNELGYLPNFVGSVEVKSQLPFYLTVLRQELIPGPTLQFQLTSIPATPVP